MIAKSSINSCGSFNLLETFASFQKKLFEELPEFEQNIDLVKALNLCNEEVKRFCTKDLSEKDLSDESNDFIERIKSTLEHLDDLVFILTPEFEIAHISPSVENTLNYNKTEILGKFFTDLLPLWDEKDHTMATLLSMSIYHEKVRAIRKKLSNKKGELTWFELRLSGIGFSSEKEQYEGFLILARDIEEQVRKEDILKHDKRVAEANNMLKSEYLANMSHEIRTPLNGIVGFSNILTHKKVDDEKRCRYVRNIESCSKQLMTLINDIIDLSKMETGQLKLSYTEFNLHELLEDLKTFYTSEVTAAGKPVKINLMRYNNLPKLTIRTDEVRLRQVLMNLMNNALKFTDTGSIDFGYVIAENEYLHFFVRDTGGGIPVEFQPYVFDAYKRAGESKPGSGLGLAICKGLVEQLNGDIQLNNKPGVGSEFVFYLPLTA